MHGRSSESIAGGHAAEVHYRPWRRRRSLDAHPPAAHAQQGEGLTAIVQEALLEIGAPGGLLDAGNPLEEGPTRLITNPELSPRNRDNLGANAGITFLGQFLDHDMTFDATSKLGVPTAPERSPNARTPALDLDSVYGGGPDSSPQLYEPID